MKVSGQGPEWELKGRHVLILFVAMFTVIIAVNVVFAVAAIRTNTGLVADEPYRKGLKYNERIAAAERQAELGWISELNAGADRHSIVVQISGAGHRSVSGLSARVRLGRPATVREDVSLVLKEQSPGQYAARVQDELAGAYIADLEVAEGGAAEATIVYRTRRRLWVEQ